MEEKQALEEAYRSEKNAKVKIRILALLYLYVDGYSLVATAKLLRPAITVFTLVTTAIKSAAYAIFNKFLPESDAKSAMAFARSNGFFPMW